jgi:transposase
VSTPTPMSTSLRCCPRWAAWWPPHRSPLLLPAIGRCWHGRAVSAVKARTRAINQLKAVLVGADPALRESLAGLGRATLIRRCAQLPDPGPTADSGAVAATVVYTLRLLARRIQHLTGEINDLTGRIRAVLADHAPQLLERRGVGPDSAATLLITAGDNPERLANEASFAALCGANPIQASSGKTRRHRLM